MGTATKHGGTLRRNDDAEHPLVLLPNNNMTVAIVKWRIMLGTVIIFLDPLYAVYLVDSFDEPFHAHTSTSGVWIDLKTDRQTDRQTYCSS